MVIDLYIANAIERGIRWVQSWTSCSIATVNRLFYTLYAVFWIMNAFHSPVRHWWSWFFVAFTCVAALSLPLMGFLFNVLDEKQKLADETNMIVPSYSKYIPELGWLRFVALIVLPANGALSGWQQGTAVLGAISSLCFIVGMYCFNVDVYPRSGSKLKDLLKALRNGLQPSKPIVLPAST